MSRSIARPTAADAVGAAEAVSGVIEQIFGTVTRVRREFSDRCSAALVSGNTLWEKDIRPIRGPVLDILGSDDVPVGLGIITAPDLLADQPLWLEWWQIKQGGAPTRLEVDLNPGRLGFYDYLAAPWFDVPRRTGQRHLVGPYVDVYGTDCYVLTFTDPVAVDGRFVGVAGADVEATRFEAVVLSRLVDSAVDVVVIGDDDRVVVSTTARWLIGSLVVPEQLPDRAIEQRVHGLSWRLFVLPGRP